MIDRRTFAALLMATALVLPLAAPARAAAAVTVFAAASLKTALDEVSAAWQAQTGIETRNAYAASSALARQIESGAPADLFISADLDWMAYLAERKLIAAGTEVKLLGNALVLVVPASSSADIAIAPGFDLAGLLGGGKLAMADVRSVPAGKYGKASLEALGVWDSVEGSLAQAENVRAALKLVALGEAPAGIVYRTDAFAEPNVRVLGTFPANTHPEIVYPAALVATSTSAEARDFLRYLQSPAALQIFTKHGFPVLANR